MTAWFKERFKERPTAVKTSCQACGRDMWLPRSKVERYKTCGGDCAFGPQKTAVAARTRPCETCGKEFTPRSNQTVGLYCSQRCNLPSHAALQSDEARKRGIIAMRARRDAGKWTIYTGSDHHSWRGGREVYMARRRASGEQAEALRRYRAKNPHKAREYAQNRKNRKRGRIPYGTIPRIGALQRWRCAICRVGIRSAYQVDHITPLARGGKHESRNIQLLCAPCNFRKNAKDPIDYMQQIGRLL